MKQSLPGRRRVHRPVRRLSAELEAIPPPTLREVLEAHLRSHIPPTRLRTLKLAEEEERKGLEQLQDLTHGVA